MRFVSVSEDYGYQRDHYPELSRKIDLDAAMAEIACFFASFGFTRTQRDKELFTWRNFFGAVLGIEPTASEHALQLSQGRSWS